MTKRSRLLGIGVGIAAAMASVLVGTRPTHAQGTTASLRGNYAGNFYGVVGGDTSTNVFFITDVTVTGTDASGAVVGTLTLTVLQSASATLPLSTPCSFSESGFDRKLTCLQGGSVLFDGHYATSERGVGFYAAVHNFLGSQFVLEGRLERGPA